MKVGFHLVGGDEWRGGISHLKVFLHAVGQTYKDEVTTCLLVPSKKSLLIDECQIADQVVCVPSFRRWSVLWGIDRAAKAAFRRDLVASSSLKRHRVDVVFGLCIPYRYDSIPTLSWVYDFQHVHMPEMFNLWDRLDRYWSFFLTAKVSTRVILMSESVKTDFELFFPRYAFKARVLKTTTYIPDSIYETDPKSVCLLYRLSEKFVYLPSQFWKHKNHEVVFKAVKLLKECGLDVVVVCSGYQADNRHPRYFAELMDKVKEWRIQGHVKFLGLIPQDHVFQLMRQSICVLNPSLFEGFGLSVDEARCVGKEVLLSDIPAHREQKIPRASFFDPRNVDECADNLKRIWHANSPGPDLELECEAWGSRLERVRACAESLMSVVREVADNRVRDESVFTKAGS
jgi:glycosyltransferase involved in cell wall biosynthesis